MTTKSKKQTNYKNKYRLKELGKTKIFHVFGQKKGFRLQIMKVLKKIINKIFEIFKDIKSFVEVQMRNVNMKRSNNGKL